MRLPNKVFDILKWSSIIALPAISTFVASVFPIWNISHADEISQTITALGTLIGALVCVSSVTYKGDEVNESENN